MQFFQNIWRPRQLVVLFIHLDKDQKTYSAIPSGKQENAVLLAQHSFESIEELVKKFGTSTAYWVHILGSGVLTRVVDRTSGFKEDLIINGEKDNFLFNSFTDGESSAVSFVRNQAIEQELTLLDKLKAHVLNISIGPIPIFQSLDDTESYFGEFVLKKQNGKIISCLRNEQIGNRTFRGMSVNDQQLIAYSLGELNKQKTDEFDFGLSDDQVRSRLEEFQQHKRFNTLGVTGVLIVLLIAIGNYFYINSLNSNVAQLEADLALSNDNLSLLDRLDQEKKRKEQLIENSGFLGNNYISFYLDKIGQSVPATIHLKTMYVFPLSEKLKEKRKVVVDTKRVEIEGVTANSVVLDDWIEKMNRFDWVESVEVLNYTKVTEQQAQFKLFMILTK